MAQPGAQHGIREEADAVRFYENGAMPDPGDAQLRAYTERLR